MPHLLQKSLYFSLLAGNRRVETDSKTTASATRQSANCGDFLKACEWPRIGGALGPPLVSETAQQLLEAPIWSFVSGLKKSFPGNGDQECQRRIANMTNSA